jgi:hypothetical protein
MQLAALLLAIVFDVHSAVADPQALAAMQQVAERGARMPDQQEVAAFIVRAEDGTLSCVMWPHTANRRSEHYRGDVPAGTVAIAHTHPIFAEHPSRGDVEQAKRIGLPIYVITRWSLYVVDADGTVTPLIVHRDWTRS